MTRSGPCENPTSDSTVAKTTKQRANQMGETAIDEDLLLKSFFAEVSEVERDNEVARYLSLYFFFPSLQLYNIYLYVYIYISQFI